MKEKEGGREEIRRNKTKGEGQGRNKVTGFDWKRSVLLRHSEERRSAQIQLKPGITKNELDRTHR